MALKLWAILVTFCCLSPTHTLTEPPHDDINYMTYLCSNFSAIFTEFAKKNDLHQKQFAVLTVNKSLHLPPDDLNINNLPMKDPQSFWNAHYTGLRNNTEHTEPPLMETVPKMLDKFLNQNHMLPSDIYLYTFRIPCVKNCAVMIIDRINNTIPQAVWNSSTWHIYMNDNEIRRQLRELRYVVSWSQEYNKKEADETKKVFDEFKKLPRDNNSIMPQLEYFSINYTSCEIKPKQNITTTIGTILKDL